MIRRARPADRPALDRLQSSLPEPSPDLLAAAMREVSATGGSSTSATTADRPALSSFDLFVAVDETRAVVGYLLAVRGDPTHVAEVVVEERGLNLYARTFAYTDEEYETIRDVAHEVRGRE